MSAPVVLALWAVQPETSYSKSIRPDPHPIRDFFIELEFFDDFPRPIIVISTIIKEL